MKCENCSSEDSYFDDRMGEEICRDCGYVMVTNILEETISLRDMEESYEGHSYTGNRFLSRNPDRGVLGSKMSYTGKSSSYIRRLQKTQTRFSNRQDTSLNRGYLDINMILSPYLPNNSLKERAHHYYKKLFFEREMIGYHIDVRACAVSLIVLRENGIPITIANISKNNGLNPAKVSKCAKKFARVLGKPYILHQLPINPWVDKVTYDLIVKKFGEVALKKAFKRDAHLVVNFIHDFVLLRDITFTKSYMASALWITVCLRSYGHGTEFTQKEIGDICNCTPVSLRNRNKELYAMLGLTKKDLSRLTVDQFIAGVRYG